MPYTGERGEAWATTGDLNRALTELVIDYVLDHGLRYQTINDVVGALESAKAEFQRRVVAPYEDTKIRENGDVYPAELLSRPRTMPVDEPKYDGFGNVARRVALNGDHQVWVATPSEADAWAGRWETVEH